MLDGHTSSKLSDLHFMTRFGIELNLEIKKFFFKNWAIPGLFFFIFVFSTVNSKYLCNKILPRLNSNKGPLVSEATALLIERQPQPDIYCNVGLILKLSSSSPTTTVLGCSLSTSAKGTTTGSMRRRPTGMNKMKV